MNERIDRLKVTIEPLRQEIINHQVYSAIKNIDDIKLFMKYHVFAVWDFMSLLKSLQNNLTCTSIPWVPVGSAETRYLINEIVVGEESDIDLDGQRISHFELYLNAMRQCGAYTTTIDNFIESIRSNTPINDSLINSNTPKEAADFVNYTFEIINSNKSYLQSAIFTFGREDLIPGMFISMIKEIHKNFPDEISIFKYYIERHIEVDGDHHSHLALQMTSNLCGDNDVYWNEVEYAVKKALEHRIKLWDGAYNEILNKQNNQCNNTNNGKKSLVY